MILDGRHVPIVLAPLAGGPSTPELTAAVSEAGGLGFLAGGYLSAGALADRVSDVRSLTGEPFGVNLFVPGAPTPAVRFHDYVGTLAEEAERAGVALGEGAFHDDDWHPKLDLLASDPVPVASFTFGCPGPDVVERLHSVGTEVWVTVTGADEARRATSVGADVLVAQGLEAGGHRGGFTDDGDGTGLLSLLQLVTAGSGTPVVASGGIATGAGIAAVLAAGARAAAVGTAFLSCPEAGTSDVHRRALRGSASTAVTRAFTGRAARGIRNRFLEEHSADAPSAYPEVHYVTAPLRRVGRTRDDPDVVNLWAGQSYPLSRELPAAELVAALHREARAAVRSAQTLLGPV
jgi:nitronate monooxygenase